jgi:hypothetical protein
MQRLRHTFEAVANCCWRPCNAVSRTLAWRVREYRVVRACVRMRPCCAGMQCCTRGGEGRTTCCRCPHNARSGEGRTAPSPHAYPPRPFSTPTPHAHSPRPLPTPTPHAHYCPRLLPTPPTPERRRPQGAASDTRQRALGRAGERCACRGRGAGVRRADPWAVNARRCSPASRVPYPYKCRRCDGPSRGRSREACRAVGRRGGWHSVLIKAAAPCITTWSSILYCM